MVYDFRTMLNNVQNCEIYFNETKATNWGNFAPTFPVEVKIIANEGYVFDNTLNGNYEVDDGMGNYPIYKAITISDSNFNEALTVYSETFSEDVFMGFYEVVFEFSNIVAVEAPEPVVLNFGIDIAGFENCKPFFNGVEAVSGSMQVEVPCILTIEANEGYEFYEGTDGYYEVGDGDGNYPIYDSITITNERMNEEKTVYTREFVEDDFKDWRGDFFYSIEFIFRNVVAIESEHVVPPVDIVNVFAGLYSPTVEELADLSEERYGHNQEPPLSSDLGTFISKLYVLPFSLDELKSVAKLPIIMGGYTLETSSYLLTDSILTLDVALFEISPTYNNAYDYVNTTTILHVPYVDSIELDVARVIDHVIKVQYSIDLYIGMLTCNIYSDDVLFETRKTDIAKEIPFKQQSENMPIGTVRGILLNNVGIPYIEVIRNVPYNDVGELGQTTEQYVQLNSVGGYIESNKINLETSATKREKEEIQRLISAGVFIHS